MQDKVIWVILAEELGCKLQSKSFLDLGYNLIYLRGF